MSRRRPGAMEKAIAALGDLPHEVVPTDVGPLLIHAHDTVISSYLRRDGRWDVQEGRVLRRLLRPGMRAVDVGANIGYFTLLMARQVGAGGRVFAVEPEPRNLALLCANLAAHGLDGVDVVPLAASSHDGEMTLVLNAENLGDHRGFGDDPERERIVVPAARLDAILDPALRIDVVKIDVQGMDHAVVQGLETTIRRWWPALIVEFEPASIAGFGDRPAEVLANYRALGYDLTLLDPLPAPLPPAEDARLVARLIGRANQNVNLLLTPRAVQTDVCRVPT